MTENVVETLFCASCGLKMLLKLFSVLLAVSQLLHLGSVVLYMLGSQVIKFVLDLYC